MYAEPHIDMKELGKDVSQKNLSFFFVIKSAPSSPGPSKPESCICAPQ
jgi:hypothetical protein